ncbi:hypothetical protein SAMN05421679_103271 [Epilithonimonas pallida]|jgi:hypothetical protein|uniref:Uncharacterized protein n=1 Tax=Epilithonimonas pallida TaxID=373671 RepID=A0ABY1R0V9_9FLAO|nr:hypothetical protein SAMN05421679_103271 [Epilithonimonas pallida]
MLLGKKQSIYNVTNQKIEKFSLTCNIASINHKKLNK